MNNQCLLDEVVLHGRSKLKRYLFLNASLRKKIIQISKYVLIFYKSTFKFSPTDMTKKRDSFKLGTSLVRISPHCGGGQLSSTIFGVKRGKKPSEKLEIYRTLPRVNISDT